MASIIFNWKRVKAESRILKQSSEQREQHFSEPLMRVLKDVGIFVGGEMFTDASGKVSIGFTNIIVILWSKGRRSKRLAVIGSNPSMLTSSS